MGELSWNPKENTYLSNVTCDLHVRFMKRYTQGFVVHEGAISSRSRHPTLQLNQSKFRARSCFRPTRLCNFLARSSQLFPAPPLPRSLQLSLYSRDRNQCPDLQCSNILRTGHSPLDTVHHCPLRTLYKLSDCRSYQLVFIDESGCDKRSGHRRQSWAPSGATPVQVEEFNREQRVMAQAMTFQQLQVSYHHFRGDEESPFEALGRPRLYPRRPTLSQRRLYRWDAAALASVGLQRLLPLSGPWTNPDRKPSARKGLDLKLAVTTQMARPGHDIGP